jgi:hypothetical protein
MCREPDHIPVPVVEITILAMSSNFGITRLYQVSRRA